MVDCCLVIISTLDHWLLDCLFSGEEDPVTEMSYMDASAMSFSKATCKATWETMGAVPLTWVCLNDPEVERELGDSKLADPISCTGWDVGGK